MASRGPRTHSQAIATSHNGLSACYFVERIASASLGRLDRLATIGREQEAALFDARKDSPVHHLVPFALTRPLFTIQYVLEGIGGHSRR